MPDERDPKREEPSRQSPSVLGDPPKPESILGPLSDLEPIFPTDEPAKATMGAEEQLPPATEPPPAPAPPRALPETVRKLHSAARFFVAASVFLVLIVFDPRTIDVFNLAKLTALWVLTAIAGGLWLAGAILDRQPNGLRLRPSLPRSWIVRGSLALLAITAVATLLSSARVLSFFGLYHRFEGFVSLALYVAVLLLIVALYKHRPDALREIVAAAGAAAVVVSGYVVLQRLGVDFESWQQVTGAQPQLPIGNLGNPALTGSFLGIALPFIVYLVSAASSWSARLAWAVGGALSVAGLLLTQSRPGIVAAIVGILATVLFASDAVKPPVKVAIVAAVLFVLAIAPLVAPGFLGPRAPARLSVVAPASASNRVHMWEAGWRMSVDRPLLGWGPESFFGNYPRYRSAAEARAQGLSITDKPHSIFLGWSTATGFIGLLTYLALVGSALWLLAAGARKLAGTYRALALCFGAGLCAYLAQGLYSIDVPPLALLGWVCLGGLAVLLEYARRERADTDDAEENQPEILGASPEADTDERPAAQRSDVFTYCAVGLAVIALVVIGVRPLRADHSAWAAERRAPAGFSVETMQLYEKAIALHPFEAAYKGLAAFYLERVAGIQTAPFRGEEALLRAARLYEQAHELQPDNIYFMINAARVYARLGNVDAKYFTDADRWMGRAATIDGLDPQVHDLYADLLAQWATKAPEANRQEINQRARTQAEIARQLRAGRPIG